VVFFLKRLIAVCLPPQSFKRWCATRTASVAAASTAARCAPRPHKRALPRGLGRQGRSPRGSHGPRARRDRHYNPKSPLGELSRSETSLKRGRGLGENLAESSVV
jgi:hypothetical protein